ncbi:aldehyde dehydrogenase 3 family, member B1 [Gamsiella multidivaricata]|uniref:aldehyde dehydrogenase 3 family, member B1 n=1 Tax=Gamsiella multidivaricata TaxID=101098 RepID=UPI00221EBD5F|nr:aldehyde dehydrogenase 3 family, member B1 [Gamsiella multidivaricata]KAG0370450.1 Aldehyde dehydrogenase 3 member B1 [Gamsiella multidivaricata]KAI7820238.1 aldehyde dehydrogenase 3 family, member B1 [Gamsiella multidivaricata]
MTFHSLHYNNEAEIDQAALLCQRTFKSGHTRPLPFRRHQLEQLWRLIDENEDQLCNAVHKDLHKHKNEVVLGELCMSKEEINTALVHLEDWTKDEKTIPALVNRIGTTCIKRKEPKGAALIIAPWNYPVYLAIAPLAGAIAAGCTAVLKPSEVAPHTAQLLSELLSRYLDYSAFIVINGAAQETTRLLKHKWDHIFYTGNSDVAKIIMKAASNNLTSLTLELGGKSPAIIDEDANLALAAKRIMFGKTFNAGQTCVAPDYILVTEKAEAKLIAALKTAALELYGDNPQNSSSYGRIVNNRHFHRLHNLLKFNKSGKIVFGGQVDELDLYIAPTVITNVDRDDKLMENEIFGPLLPIIRVADVDDAIEFINSKHEPLALYVFSNNKKLVKKVLDSTRSGGALVNDTLMHVSESSLPFGGIGNSGMGSYHGKSSFDAFTHVRSVMIKTLTPVSEMVMNMRYAPYTSSKLAIGKLAIEHVPYFKRGFLFRNMKWIALMLVFGLGYKRALA